MSKSNKINHRFSESPCWYFARKDLFDSIVKNKHFITGKILDVGCGSKPYKEMFETTEYIGLEYDCEQSRKNPKADFFYDGKHFPFENNSFDSVLSTQVLEHVPNPHEVLAEIVRVLNPGGYLMLSVPFAQEEHESPYDFYRFSPYAIQDMFNKAGLEIIEYKRLTCGVKAVISIITFYIYRVARWKIANLLSTFFNALGIVLYKIFKKEGNIYINNFIIAQKKGGD